MSHHRLARPMLAAACFMLAGCFKPFPATTAGGYHLAPLPAGVAADACDGPPQLAVRGNWPQQDVQRAALLPVGCATAGMIAAQIVDPGDLLRGRVLPPGAATPFADAVEKYYRRNAVPDEGGAGGGGGGGGGGTESVPHSGGSAAAGTGAGAGGSANPLLTPSLTPAP